MPPSLFGLLALVFLGQILYLLSAAQGVDHTDRVISRANALLKLLVDGETGMRGYLITGDPVFLEPFHVEEAQIGPAFEELKELVADNPIQIERLEALKLGHADWKVYAERMIELRRAGGDYQAPVRNREGKRRMDAMRARVADFIGVEEAIREDRNRTTRRATWVVVGSSLTLALVLGSGLARLTRRRLIMVSRSYQASLAEVIAQAQAVRASALRLATLHEIDRAILTEQPIPELMRSALGQLVRVVPVADAFVIAFAPDGRPAEVFSRDGPPLAALSSMLEGVEPSEFRPGTQMVPDLRAAERSPMQDRLYRAGQLSCVKIPLETGGKRFGSLVFAAPVSCAFTNEDLQVAEEIARQIAIAFQHDRMRDQLRRHAEELERKVEARTRDLRESLNSVKQLQGLLPICAWCKKVRDDQNYWHKVEHYVTTHTDAKFTHAICPNCEKKILDEYEQ